MATIGSTLLPEIFNSRHCEKPMLERRSTKGWGWLRARDNASIIDVGAHATSETGKMMRTRVRARVLNTFAAAGLI